MDFLTGFRSTDRQETSGASEFTGVPREKEAYQKSNNFIIVGWHINEECNFDCQYCNQRKKYAKPLNLDIGTLKSCFAGLRKRLIIKMSGGEPFLFHEFVGLCSALTERHSISINSNISTRNVFEFADRIDPDRVLHITASLHIQNRERLQDGLKKYIEKILYLQRKGFKVIASYLAYPPLLSRIAQDYKLLKRAGIIAFQVEGYCGTYRKRPYPESYTREEKSLLQALGMSCADQAVLTKMNSFFGQKCLAGARSFSLHADGTMFRCNQSHISQGNLFLRNFRLQEHAKPCPFFSCSCPFYGISNALSQFAGYGPTTGELLRESFFKWEHRLKTFATEPELALKRARRFFSPAR